MIAPEYPRHAQREGVQGTVALDAVVSAEGVVTQLKYRSGPEALSAAAMDAVRWWRYEPFLVNGQPTAVQTTIAVDFRLDNSSYLGHADTLMVRQHHPSASPVSTK
jgi:protein TonB